MNGITVTMAIVDYIPVILFFIAAIILLGDLYFKLSRSNYTLLASGTIMVFLAGTLKATWKILYALQICDYQTLDTCFFPMQGIGFLLFFIGILGMFQQKKQASLLSIVPIYASNMPFIILQIIGCAGAQWALVIKSLQMKKKSAAILFIIAFIFMLAMGYLSAKFDDSSTMHWIAQCVNIVSQGALLSGTWILHKAGLRN